LKSILRGVAKAVGVILVVAVVFPLGMWLRSWVDSRRPVGISYQQLTDARGGSAQADSVGPAVAVKPAETFSAVLDIMRSEYVEKIEDESKLSAGAVRTMLYALDDPATRYWTPEQYRILLDQMEGEYRGIGAVVGVVKTKRNGIEQRRVTVVAPIPGGPAAKAGVLAGDTVVEIDGRWVIAYDPRLDLNRLALRNMPEAEYRRVLKDATKKLTDGISWPRALERLVSPKDETPIRLTLERAGESAPITVTVKPESFKVSPVAYRQMSQQVGYLRIGVFSPGVPEEVRRILSEHSDLKGLVVDLRDNPGGPDLDGPQGVSRSLAAALSALGIKGRVGTIVKGTSKRPIIATGNGKVPRMAVLLNRGTANVAEVAAAACDSLANAVTVGTPSRGDGTYQKLVKLKTGAMTVTGGKWLTSEEKPLPSTGLTPDVAVAGGKVGADPDPVLARALAVLAKRGGGA